MSSVDYIQTGGLAATSIRVAAKMAFVQTVQAGPVHLGNLKLHWATNQALTGATVTALVSVDTDMDGCAQFSLTGLTPDQRYYCGIEVDGVVDSSKIATWKTPASAAQSFSFIMGSCNYTESDHPIWDRISTEDPLFLTHIGDLHYHDYAVNNKALFDAAYTAQFKMPKFNNMLLKVPFENQWDDHDWGSNNSDRTSPSGPAVYASFNQHVAHYSFPPGAPTNATYRAWTVGRVRFILTDARSQRDPWQDTDSPAKTMLGTIQKAWFKAEVLAAHQNTSIALIVWLTPVSWSGDFTDPRSVDYLEQGGRENWMAYTYERAEIATWLHANSISNLMILCGDSHMCAMDDGRNTCYATDTGLPTGTRLDIATIPEPQRIPLMNPTPFDKDTDLDGGPYQIDGTQDSGGPFPMFNNVYGKIRVSDKGEDWIQVTMEAWVWDPWLLDWNLLRSFTFTRPAAGAAGYPTTSPRTYNGYVGKTGSWHPVVQRHVGKASQWKRVTHRFVGVNGLWKLAFLDGANDGLALRLDYLDGYSLEPGNFLQIHGRGFLSTQFPSPKRGAFYELLGNQSDIFGNFSNATTVGSTLATGSGLQIGAGGGIVLPHTSQNLFGSTTAVSLAVSVWCSIPTLPAAGHYNALWFSNGNGLFVDSNGRLVLQAGLTFFTTTETVLLGQVNKIILNHYGKDPSLSRIYLNGVASSVDLATLVFPPQASPQPVYLGQHIELPSTTVHATGYTFSNVYVLRGWLWDSNIQVLNLKPTPKVVFKDTTSGVETIIPEVWFSSQASDTRVALTLPATFPNGNYEVSIQGLTQSTNWLPAQTVTPSRRETPLVDNFRSPSFMADNWSTLHRAWGGANGGVVRENVKFSPEGLILEAHGDLYAGAVQGVDRDGNPKTHTQVGDPKLGQSWNTRVGACISLKEKTGYGSYRIRAKIVSQLGVCSAFWTFFYNEVYPGSPYYSAFQAEGLHEQGNATDGYYLVRNHEIDIEFPTTSPGGGGPTLSAVNNNTWRGELFGEFNVNHVDLGFSAGDDQFHDYRFDWHSSAVEFYVDGVLTSTSSVAIPDISGHFTMGVWFPSSPLAIKPWLVDPVNGWAGGAIDTDGGLKANWDTQTMQVESFSFTPFVAEANRNLGETYVFGGTRTVRT